MPSIEDIHSICMSPFNKLPTSDFFAVLMDQGRGRSVAPTRPILRPQTRYKGRGC